MSETLNLTEYRQAHSDTILDFPRIDGNIELDMILNHARRYGRTLFTVAGDELIRIYPVLGEVKL